MIKQFCVLLALIAFSVQAEIILPPVGGGGAGGGGDVTTAQLVNASNLVMNLVGIYTNVVYVNATGATATINGSVLTNAVKNAPVGSCVVVGPGNYFAPILPAAPSVMLKDLVDQYWMPGAHFYANGNGEDPADLFSDDAGVIRSKIMGYGWFSVTNDVASSIVLNMGNNASTVDMECWAMEAGGEGGIASVFTTGSNTKLSLKVRSHMYSRTYDIGFGSGSGSRLYWECPRVYSGQDIFEFTDFDNWGDCVVRLGYCLNTNGGSLFQIGAKQDVVLGHVDAWANSYGGSFLNAGTNGLLHDTTIQAHPTNTVPVIGPVATVNASTELWMKDCTIIGPSGVDPISITNRIGRPLILDNCTIIAGASATNWARFLTAPSSVEIRGTLSTKLRSVHTNVTVQADNRFVLSETMVAVATAGLAATNLDLCFVGANQLTNNNSLMEYSISGVTTNGPSTNRFQLINGSETVLDTGSQAATAGTAWTILATIQRIGNTEQVTQAAFLWNGAGIPFAMTNAIAKTVQTNGISTALRLAVTSSCQGSATNRSRTLAFVP